MDLFSLTVQWCLQILFHCRTECFQEYDLCSKLVGDYSSVLAESQACAYSLLGIW